MASLTKVRLASRHAGAPLPFPGTMGGTEQRLASDAIGRPDKRLAMPITGSSSRLLGVALGQGL